MSELRGIKGTSYRKTRLRPEWLWSIAAAALMIVLLPALSANSHVLEGPHVLELMTQNLEGAKTLRVEQQVTVEDDSIADHSLALRENLSYSFPDRFRMDTWYENTSRIYVRSGSEAVTIIDGYRTKDGENRFDRYKDLLLYRSRSVLHKMLLSYNVDTGITSLGKFEDRVVYVIGAQFPDESVSQLWVDKESLLPLRWLNIATPESQDRLEFIYRDWQKKDNLWYPTRIETRHQRLPIRRIVAMGLQVDVDLPGELFDIAKMLQTFPPEESAAEPGASEANVDEVQQTIEQFQKKFED